MLNIRKRLKQTSSFLNTSTSVLDTRFREREKGRFYTLFIINFTILYTYSFLSTYLLGLISV